MEYITKIASAAWLLKLGIASAIYFQAFARETCYRLPWLAISLDIYYDFVYK